VKGPVIPNACVDLSRHTIIDEQFVRMRMVKDEADRPKGRGEANWRPPIRVPTGHLVARPSA